MGVAIAGNDRDSGPRRLIMNVKVSNWAPVAIAGDTSRLPKSGQWRCLGLEDVETPLLSGEDFEALFLCVRVAEALAPLDGLCSLHATQPRQSWHIGRSAHGLGVGHGTRAGCRDS